MRAIKLMLLVVLIVNGLMTATLALADNHSHHKNSKHHSTPTKKKHVTKTKKTKAKKTVHKTKTSKSQITTAVTPQAKPAILPAKQLTTANAQPVEAILPAPAPKLGIPAAQRIKLPGDAPANGPNLTKEEQQSLTDRSKGVSDSIYIDRHY